MNGVSEALVRRLRSDHSRHDAACGIDCPGGSVSEVRTHVRSAHGVDRARGCFVSLLHAPGSSERSGVGGFSCTHVHP